MDNKKPKFEMFTPIDLKKRGRTGVRPPFAKPLITNEEYTMKYSLLKISKILDILRILNNCYLTTYKVFESFAVLHNFSVRS
jgi:hypothetical protein